MLGLGVRLQHTGVLVLLLLGSLAGAGYWGHWTPSPLPASHLESSRFSSRAVAPIVTSHAAPSLPLTKAISISVGTAPWGMALNVSGTNLSNDQIFVTNSGSNSVSVISGSTNRVSNNLSLGSWCGTGPVPTAIAFDPANGYLYIADNHSGTAGKYCVGVFSAATGSKVSVVTTPGRVSALLYNPDNKEIYAADALGQVDVISGTSLVTSLVVGSLPAGLAFNAYNRYVYVTNSGSNNLTLIDNVSVVANVSGFTDPTGIAFDSGTGALYISDTNANNSTVVSSKTVLGNVSVGAYPQGAAYDGIDAAIFVADSGSGAVTEIHSQSVTGTYPVGLRPWAVAYDGLNDYVYVTNEGSGNVSALYVPNPTVTSFSAQPAAIDQGMTTRFSAVVSGGTPPYNYSYGGVLPPGCNFPNAPTFQCTPTGPGNYNVSVIVSDANGITASRTTSLNIAPSPHITSFSLVPSQVTLGNSTFANVTVQGGTAPLSFLYAPVPPGCSSQNISRWTCLPNTTGSFTIRVTVTDAFGETNQTQALLTVNPFPSNLTFSAGPSELTLGNSTNLSVQMKGGTAPFTYRYVGLPTGCASADTPTLFCSPTATGYFPVKVFVTDSDGNSLNRSAGILVNPKPSVQSFVALPSVFTLGNQTKLRVTVSGGTAPMGYAYTGLPPGCATGSTANLTCTPSQSGTYRVQVTAHDADGDLAQQSLTLVVNPVPSVTYFNITPPVIAVGRTTYLNASVSYGTAPYSYAYAGLPPGCSSQSVAALACTPTVPGSYTINVTVTDTDGVIASSFGDLSVLAPQGLTVVTFTAVPEAFALGNSTVFTVQAAGGTPPYAFSYSGLPPGCASSNASNLRCTPTSPGNYSVVASVTDASGTSVNRTTMLEVTGTIRPLSVMLSSSSVNVVVGSRITLSVQVTGGVGPFLYRWSLNGTNGSWGGPSRTVYLAGAGTYVYEVWVTDGNGIIAGSNGVVVTVTSVTLGKGETNSIWSESLLGLPVAAWLGVIAVGLALVIVLLFRRMSARSRAAAEAEEAETLPIKSPKGYYDDFATPPAEPKGLSKSPFGTFEPPSRPIPVASGEEKPAIYRPFALKITPDGIEVNEVKQSTPKNEEPGSVAPLPPTASEPTKTEAEVKIPTREDAYGVFLALAKRPRTLGGIRKDVPLAKPELVALMDTLVQAGLVARTKTEKRGTVYALTPVGRNLGHQFISATPKKSRTVKAPSSKASPVSTSAKAPPTSVSARKETPESKVVLERRIGEARTKEDPFDGKVRPEDINPNVQRLDPRLLQPLEMRVVADTVTETPVPPGPSPEAAAKPAKKERKPRKKASKYGVERAKRPPDSQG